MSVSTTKIEYAVEPTAIQELQRVLSDWIDNRLVSLQIWSAKQQDWVTQQHGESPKNRLQKEDVSASHSDLQIGNFWLIPAGSLVTIEGDIITLLTITDRLIRFVRQ